MANIDANLPTDLADVVLVIPALNPPDGLLDYVRGATETGFERVYLVDDGSRAEFRSVFDEAEELPGVRVLRHEVNRGKGAALRLALDESLTDPDVIGVVTTDADGQHALADVRRVAEAFVAVQRLGGKEVVFGVRDFSGADVPPKSRMGNQITSAVLQALFGRYVSDTQTGLRAFPRRQAEVVARVPGDRFEYEMNVLLALLGAGTPISEVPIATIYHDLENSVSNFRPVQDATRIYGAIFKRFATTNSVRRNAVAAGLALVAVLRVLRRR